MSTLRVPGMSLADWPGRPLALNLRPAMAWLESGMEREAFEALRSDEARIECFRKVHGNRLGPKPKRRQVETLFRLVA